MDISKCGAALIEPLNETINATTGNCGINSKEFCFSDTPSIIRAVANDESHNNHNEIDGHKNKII